LTSLSPKAQAITRKAGKQMIRVAVAGVAGRMGKTLVQAINDSATLTFSAGFEHAGHPQIGDDVGVVCGMGELGLEVSADVQQQINDFDVVIDFTVPTATLGLAQICAAQGKGMVVGTTGFDDAQLQALRDCAQQTAIFVSPNMSVGVNLAMHLIELAAKALGDEVDIEVIEAHHKHKIDAPSGTAVRIGEVLASALGRDLSTDAVYARQGITGARDAKTIGFSTIRGGDIVGEHTVLFAGDGERLEITHRAHSRNNFARGALRAVTLVSAASPGWYDMQDLLGI
jgi:4-hydroxy-tetrahydrodipicolinate reductase